MGRFEFDNRTWNAKHIKRVGELKQCQGGWYVEIETPLGTFYVSRPDFEQIEAARAEFIAIWESEKTRGEQW